MRFIKTVVLIGALGSVMAVGFQNCAPSSFFSAPMASTDAPVSPETPQAVACTEPRLQELYQLSVTTHQVPIEAYAKNCVDSSNTYQQIMSHTTGFNKTRFLNTCAVRWCSSKAISDLYGAMIGLEKGEALGALKRDVIYTAQGPAVPQTLLVECRNNFQFIEDEADSCLSVVENKRPVVAYEVPYHPNSLCGASAHDASYFYNHGDPRSCATTFCLRQNDGFKWGLLSEISPDGLRIVCSRTDL